MTLCNMVVEAGGKNGVVPADATTAKYLEGKTSKPYQVFTSDGNARYTNPAIHLCFIPCWLTIFIGFKFLVSLTCPLAMEDPRVSAISNRLTYLPKIFG